MKAAEALRTARATGVEISLDGNDPVLEAASPPPERVLDALSRNKAEIVALLRPDVDGWSADDWQVYFDERAGIAEFDGGLPRPEAGAQAFAWAMPITLPLPPIKSPSSSAIVIGS